MSKIATFISYCHRDEEDKNEFEKWISQLISKDRISVFSDSNIIPSKELFEEIDNHLLESEIIILLLTQNYLASKPCIKEMEFALLNRKTKVVIPIIVKRCNWLETECKEIKALPKDGVPINEWPIKDKGWQDVFIGISAILEDFEKNWSVKNEYLDEIQKVEFVNENKGNVKLDDIFVFPNLSTTSIAFEKEIIKQDLFFENNEKAIIIKGGDLSGKTAFLRYLFLEYSKDFPTILIEGMDIYKKKDFKECIRKAFKYEFSGDFNKWYKNENKIILIDNFHHDISNNFLSFLQEEDFSKIILSMNEEEYFVYLPEDQDIVNYKVITLEQFSLNKQEELLIKWSNIGRNQKNDEHVDYERIDQVEDKVNNIISKNRIVPRYPFYILSIIQSLEGFMPTDTKITAFGHCYQALIFAQLIKKGIKTDQIDSCINYLKELAFAIYKKKAQSEKFTLVEYDHYKTLYNGRFIISDNLLNRLENESYSILHFNKGEEVFFSLEYIYFFFLGMYLAEKDDSSLLDKIIEKINLRKNALILIFTIHHTQNKELLDTILLHCLCTFDKIPPAELTSEETEFMNQLIQTLPAAIASGQSTEENRKVLNDQKEKEFSNNNDEEIELDDINKGIRIIDVLGQILKNRAGSYEKEYVRDILEHTINLGLRILNLFLRAFRTEEFKEWLSKKVEEADKESLNKHKHVMSRDKKEFFIEKNIQVFGYVITIGMINRITSAISSDKLTKEISILAENKSTPAYFIIDYLQNQIQNGIHEENLRGLMSNFDKTKNIWAKKTLSYYVQNFLNSQKIAFDKRQRIFHILGIQKYIPNKTWKK